MLRFGLIKEGRNRNTTCTNGIEGLELSSVEKNQDEKFMFNILMLFLIVTASFINVFKSKCKVINNIIQDSVLFSLVHFSLTFHNHSTVF